MPKINTQKINNLIQHFLLFLKISPSTKNIDLFFFKLTRQLRTARVGTTIGQNKKQEDDGFLVSGQMNIDN